MRRSFNMNLLKYVLSVLIATSAFAQAAPIRNDTPTQLRDLGSNLTVGRNFAVNKYGQLQCTLAAGDSPAAGPIKLEDSGHTSGDAGLQILGVTNTAAFFNRSGSQGDYVPPQIDTDGRMAVNAFGAQATEFIQGCNTAITTATTGAMLAADASNRFYISSWNCTNTGGAATRVILEDGDGTDFANVMLPATTGSASVQFPVPVRLGAINKAAQINVITTGTSTICCFNGFKAAN